MYNIQNQHRDLLFIKICFITIDGPEKKAVDWAPQVLGMSGQKRDGGENDESGKIEGI